MWEEHKRRRFQELRQRDIEGELTEAERTELSGLIEEVEALEADTLRPAVERLRQEREDLEIQNRSLENLVHRKEDLVIRLRRFLGEAEAERRAIERELNAVLAGHRGSEMSE